MPFEQRVRELCDRLIACNTESEAIHITRELRALMHEHIEELRVNVVAFQVLDDRMLMRA